MLQTYQIGMYVSVCVQNIWTGSVDRISFMVGLLIAVIEKVIVIVTYMFGPFIARLLFHTYSWPECFHFRHSVSDIQQGLSTVPANPPSYIWYDKKHAIS